MSETWSEHRVNSEPPQLSAQRSKRTPQVHLGEHAEFALKLLERTVDLRAVQVSLPLVVPLPLRGDGGGRALAGWLAAGA